MVSEINADTERIGVVMTYEEDLQHRLWHRDKEWQSRLDEKDALLKQKNDSLMEKDLQLSEQAKLIEDLRKQIEALQTQS